MFLILLLFYIAGLQVIGTAIAIGFVGGGVWMVYSRGNHKTWEKLNKVSIYI